MAKIRNSLGLYAQAICIYWARQQAKFLGL